MKLLYISLILFLVLSTCSSKISRKSKNHHKRSHSHRATFVGDLVQFAEGVVIALSGSNGGLEECLPAEWKVNDPNKSNVANTNLSTNGGIFQTIVNVLKQGIKLACSVKSTIIGFLSKKTLRRFRRRRFFMMMRTTKGKKKLRRWFVSSIVNAAKSVGNAVASGVTSVGNAVASGAKMVGNAVLSGATAIFNGLVAPLKKVFAYFKSFFSSPLFTQVKNFINCLRTKFDGKALKENIQKFIMAVDDLLQGWHGFVKLIVNTVCNWVPFEASIVALVASIKSTGRDKWLKFGQYIGDLIIAVGSAEKLPARRRHFR